MEAAPSALDVERRKQVRLRVRPDLSISTQRYEGKTYYVVKDPVSLRYYRLDEKHSFLVKYLDGTHTLEETQKEFEKRFRPDRLTLEELESFAQQLLMAGLVHNESPQAGKLLYDRRKKRLRQEWLQTLTNILYIKIPVFDPDRLLTRMLHYLRWIFTAWFAAASVGVMVSALLLVLTHFETFYQMLPSFHEFFNFKTLGFMWLSLGVVKVIHEFGHGLSCKAFGGEVHEMGFLILVLSPALYCNVSDAWTLPNKWKRILISFAGIYVELMIAALATFVWWNSPGQPFVHKLSLSLMVVCSVSTVVFNGNPLMRYDGYYVLADWLEIPNLRDRANRFIKNFLAEFCLGVEDLRPEPYMALDRRIFFVTFTVVSYLYRWFVTFAILRFLSVLLKPYKLDTLSNLLAVAALGSMVGWPLYSMGKNLYKRGRLPDMKRGRVTATACVVGALLVAFFTVPLPVSRVRQLALVEVQPDAATKIFVVEPGILESLHVRDGQPVQAGDLLAEFRNVDLENQLASARSELTIRVVQLKALRDRAAATTDPQELAKIQVELTRTRGERDAYAKLADVYEQRSHYLELRAPRDGVVMSPPRVDEVGKQWDKDLNTPFCTVGDPTRLRALMPVSPADYRLLKEDLGVNPNLAVTMLVQGREFHTWRGRVGTLPESEAKEVPVPLTSKAGGPVAVKPNPADPRRNEPQNQQYLIPIEFLDRDNTVCPGAFAQVKVHCRWRTAAWWAWRTISSAFDLGLV